MPAADTRQPNHDFAEAKSLAERSFELLIAHRIAPTPQHYAVAYAYASGANAELRATIDQRLRAGRGLDAFLFGELHERFVAIDPYRNLRGVGGNLQQLVESLAHSVGEAGAGAAEFGRALEAGLGHLDDLDADSGAQAIEQVVVRLVDATRSAAQQNDKLQQQLQSTLAETEALRGELEQQRQAALHDPLTGLLNRRALDAQLDELMAVESDAPLSVLMVDIDHFKRINDTYGHALGDAVIRDVADVIRKCIRGADRAVRYGGEEFLVLLPHTGEEGAAQVAENIRSRIHSLRLVRKRDNFMLEPFTASLGVATRLSEDTRETLLQRADVALYASKGGGRNRVTVGGRTVP